MQYDMSDTRQNKIQLFAFVIAASMCALFSVCFTASGQLEVGQSCETELASRINPNDASAASLVRLPGVGVVRAEAIVAYRENFSKQNNGKPAFETIDDLQKIRGIGPKTVENISQYLEFERKWTSGKLISR